MTEQIERANNERRARVAAGNPTTDQLNKLARLVFVDGLVPAEYMPAARAASILDDTGPDQLYAFDPRPFTHAPQEAVTLTAAALTRCHAIGSEWFTGWWNSDAGIAMWSIRSCIRELAEYVPSAVTYLHAALIGEATPPLYIARSLAPLRHHKRVRPGYVYVLRSSTGAYKIGYATNPADRLKTFSVKLPFEVEYELLIKTDDMRRLEAELHEYYSDKRINGEWFSLTPADIEALRGLDGVQ